MTPGPGDGPPGVCVSGLFVLSIPGQGAGKALPGSGVILFPRQSACRLRGSLAGSLGGESWWLGKLVAAPNPSGGWCVPSSSGFADSGVIRVRAFPGHSLSLLGGTPVSGSWGLFG